MAKDKEELDSEILEDGETIADLDKAKEEEAFLRKERAEYIAEQAKLAPKDQDNGYKRGTQDMTRKEMLRDQMRDV